MQFLPNFIDEFYFFILIKILKLTEYLCHLIDNIGHRFHLLNLNPIQIEKTAARMVVMKNQGVVKYSRQMGDRQVFTKGSIEPPG